MGPYMPFARCGMGHITLPQRGGHTLASLGCRHTSIDQRHFNVLGNVQIVDEIEVLEHKPHTGATAQGEILLGALGDVLAHEPVVASRG